jgi:hypothetical protein
MAIARCTAAVNHCAPLLTRTSAASQQFSLVRLIAWVRQIRGVQTVVAILGATQFSPYSHISYSFHFLMSQYLQGSIRGSVAWDYLNTGIARYTSHLEYGFILSYFCTFHYGRGFAMDQSPHARTPSKCLKTPKLTKTRQKRIDYREEIMYRSSDN